MQQKVLIVGAGPAGTAAAYFLSRGDFDITVAERLGETQYERYHRICGGGVSRKIFRKLNLPPYGRLNDVDAAEVEWPDGTVVKMRIKGYVIDRVGFLSSLRKDCESRGVKFVRMSVQDVKESENRYIVCGKSYDWIIGADGASSLIRKFLFGTKPMSSGTANVFISGKKHSDKLVFRVRDDGSGTYTWEFPHGNMCNSGGMKGLYDEQDCVFRGSRNIPVGGIGRIVKGNALLIGDAAAMANPISYGGLKAAFISAEKASDAIMRNNPESYQKWWDRSIFSDRRFMEVAEKLKEWTPKEMSDAVKPFRRGNPYLCGLKSLVIRPKNAKMYFGCMFAFWYGW